jgi:o-succinylbenzoate synthase
MLTARYRKHTLYFRKPAGTSRGVLLSKNSFFIQVTDPDRPGVAGIGECSIIPGLSPDDRPGLVKKLSEICRDINRFSLNTIDLPAKWPGISTGIEMALQDLKTGGNRSLFTSAFTDGKSAIPIHGLIWMGKPENILRQIDEKLNGGFRVIKMKIGALPFDEELRLIGHIRKHFKEADVEIRLDANGAFSPVEAPGKLGQLAAYHIHSVEQPIRPGQEEAMAELCQTSPVPVALDEELIDITDTADKIRLLDTIRPQYIVIKPSLLGGFKAAESWIQIAGKTGCKWWINSALESNIGLNALAQWTSSLNNPIVQGLGTGGLYTNNFASPLTVLNGQLCYNPGSPWDLTAIV